MSNIHRGNFNVKDKNYSYTFSRSENKKHVGVFILAINENKKTVEIVEETENRKIKQSITTWVAIDPDKQKDLEKILKTEFQVIDKKINEIEVKPVVEEKNVIEEVTVKKEVEAYAPQLFAEVNVYIMLSSNAARLFAQKYVINNPAKK